MPNDKTENDANWIKFLGKLNPKINMLKKEVIKTAVAMVRPANNAEKTIDFSLK